MKIEKSQSSFTWWSMECLGTHRLECANYENGVLSVAKKEISESIVNFIRSHWDQNDFLSLVYVTDFDLRVNPPPMGVIWGRQGDTFPPHFEGWGTQYQMSPPTFFELVFT